VSQHLFGLKEPQLLLDVMLHLGTLLAVLIIFRADLWQIANGLWQRVRTGTIDKGDQSLRLLGLLILASIPVGIIGLVFKDYIEAAFANPFYVGLAFLLTGLILWLSKFAPESIKQTEQTTWVDALIIGFSQALAIIPGISRSGTTISMAMLLGLDRPLAAKFSFLMAIPAIIGATFVQLQQAPDVSTGQWPPIILGTAIAFFSGYAALKILIRLVNKGDFSKFAYYCWSIGLLTTISAFYGYI
jgi:undecaprenyl-diphosphatase